MYFGTSSLVRVESIMLRPPHGFALLDRPMGLFLVASVATIVENSIIDNIVRYKTASPRVKEQGDVSILLSNDNHACRKIRSNAGETIKLPWGYQSGYSPCCCYNMNQLSRPFSCIESIPLSYDGRLCKIGFLDGSQS